MIRPIKFKRETRLIEIPMCLGITVIFLILCNLGQNVTRAEGIGLIVLFALFITYTIFMAIKGEKFENKNQEQEEKFNLAFQNKIPIEKFIISKPFLNSNFESWWWCGPFALG